MIALFQSVQVWREGGEWEGGGRGHQGRDTGEGWEGWEEENAPAPAAPPPNKSD